MKKAKKTRTVKVKSSKMNKTFKTYDEYFKYLNDVAISKSLDGLLEVPSLEEAEEAGQMIVEAINTSLTEGFQPNKDKTNYALIRVQKKDKNYLVCSYQLNEAFFVLRATDLDTKKTYLPTKIWAVMTNAETDESDVVMVLGMDTHP